MEKLLLIAIAAAVVLFGILYIVFLYSERKFNSSHYWRVGKTKSLLNMKTKEEFLKKDLKIKVFKLLLNIVISSRNNIQKGLNELKNLMHLVSKRSLIRKDDLTILERANTEVHIVKENLTDLFKGNNKLIAEDFADITQDLMDILNNYTTGIQNILNANQNTLKNIDFISHEIQHIEVYYRGIVEIHSQLIKQFQESISSVTNQN